jgi:hypothetical protein
MLTGRARRSRGWFARKSNSYHYTPLQSDSLELGSGSGSMYKQRIITGAICAVLVMIIIFVIVRKLT